MQKIISNRWYREAGKPYTQSKIVRHDIDPEGLNVERIRFIEAGALILEPDVGHIISIFRGDCTLALKGYGDQALHFGTGVHLYIPPGLEARFEAEPSTEFMHVSSPTACQARGQHLLIRDEKFIPACAVGSQSLRWIFTPQYLSRRIFLYHDQTLLSKSGNPVSWFRTTMFDVAGLPENEVGEPVFKMSYNSRTELNVCYDVKGEARVRMAKHPYKKNGQLWDSWQTLDGDTTYHLNESAHGPDEESFFDERNRTVQYLRNKHEISIIDGYVSLFCLFDPAPIGIERHQPGEYSDYEPLSHVLGTKLYEIHQQEIARCDEMVDRLSLAKATGQTSTLQSSSLWQLYEKGREEQMSIEKELVKKLTAEGSGREKVLEPWIQSIVDSRAR